MLQAVNDLRVKGEALSYGTRLPKSFVALLVSSLKEYGVDVRHIYDKGTHHEIATSLGTVEMEGTFSVNDVKHKLYNDVYGVLNERFDKRVELLHSKGFKYYKNHSCFAKSEQNIKNGWCLTNSAIMYMDDFLFGTRLENLTF